jgi:hypothetical protein
MSVLNDLKRLLKSIQSICIFPFSHIPILSSSLFLIISSSHFLIISDAWSANYYVDATNGNDKNNGLSLSTAWKTIAKVDGSRFNPGDQILSLRKEAWIENVNSPSIFGLVNRVDLTPIFRAKLTRGNREVNVFISAPFLFFPILREKRSVS